MLDKQILHIMNRYEQKLIELMGKDDFAKFSTTVAKEAFRSEIEDMAPGDFKDFCLKNFDKITGDSDGDA